VPPPRPTTYTGQPMTKAVRLEGFAATTATPTRPGPPDNTAAFTALTVFGGGAFLKRGDAEFGASLEVATPRDATPTTKEIAETPPHEVVIAGVASARRSLRTSFAGFAIGLAGELGFVRIPMFVNGRRENAVQGMYRIGIVPSWRTGGLTVFGGLTFASTPEIPAEVQIEGGTRAETDVGSAAIITSVGASVVLDEGITLTTRAAKPWATTADHGLQLDLVLGFELGDPAP
jgi:hypothetical protein